MYKTYPLLDNSFNIKYFTAADTKLHLKIRTIQFINIKYCLKTFESSVLQLFMSQSNTSRERKYNLRI